MVEISASYRVRHSLWVYYPLVPGLQVVSAVAYHNGVLVEKARG